MGECDNFCHTWLPKADIGANVPALVASPFSLNMLLSQLRRGAGVVHIHQTYHWLLAPDEEGRILVVMHSGH